MGEAGTARHESEQDSRPFKCRACGQTFSTEELLKRHDCPGEKKEEEEKVQPVRTGTSTLPIDLGAYKTEARYDMK